MNQIKADYIKHGDNENSVREFLNIWTAQIEESLSKIKNRVPEEHPLRGVFYTDGGCKPNPGPAGLGIHGYVYIDIEPKKGHGCKGFIPTQMGYKESATEEFRNVTTIEYVDMVGSIATPTTNNEAEALAFLETLKICIRFELSSAHFILDSEYVLKGCMEWMPEWESNNWTKADGQPPANVEVWKQISTHLNKLKTLGCTVTWEWTRGHDDNVGNELADYNAIRGRICAAKRINQMEIIRSPAQGYWSPDVDRHILISDPRWYFKMNDPKSHKTEDGKYCYHFGHHGPKDDWFGKKISTSNFAVLHLENPDLTLDAIRDGQEKADKYKHNSIVIGRLDEIYKPRIWNEIMKSGHDYLQRIGEYIHLHTANKIQLTNELRIPRLALKAMEDLQILDDILTDLRLGKSSDFYQLTPINDIIYESVEEKNKTIRKLKLGTDQHAIQVDAKYKMDDKIKTATVTLTIGVDTPKRNTLAALAKTDAEMWCVTWKESNLAFRYAMLVKVGNDYGLWVGHYSNLCLV